MENVLKSQCCTPDTSIYASILPIHVQCTLHIAHCTLHTKSKSDWLLNSMREHPQRSVSLPARVHIVCCYHLIVRNSLELCMSWEYTTAPNCRTRNPPCRREITLSTNGNASKCSCGWRFSSSPCIVVWRMHAPHKNQSQFNCWVLARGGIPNVRHSALAHVFLVLKKFLQKITFFPFIDQKRFLEY